MCGLQLRRVGATFPCSAWASYCGDFSCCGAWALGTQTSVAHGVSSCGSPVLEHRLSSCGARAQLLCDMWDLPGPGLKPVSHALAGGFLTTAPPGKSHYLISQISKQPSLLCSDNLSGATPAWLSSSSSLPAMSWTPPQREVHHGREEARDSTSEPTKGAAMLESGGTDLSGFPSPF